MGLFAPPVLDYDGRKTLRSLADALERLRELDELSDQEIVSIHVWPLKLFDGRQTACVSVVRPRRSDGSMFVVLMPSSGAFTGRTTRGDLVTGTIDLMSGATSDSEGNVELRDGRFLHSVVLKPVPFYKFSKIDDEIVRLTLEFLQVEDECYRPLEPKLLPGIAVLDYSLVKTIRIKRVKPVQHYVLKRLDHLSPSAVRAALIRAGMHLPRADA